MTRRPTEPGHWRMALAGDVMLGRVVNEALRHRPPAYVWGTMLPALRAADLRIVNLECVISDRGRKWDPLHKAFHFRARPEAIAALDAARIDCVTLANNHVLDYGEEALRDSLRRLDAAGIGRAGAGGTLAEAARAAWLDAAGRRVAVLACTDNMPEWAAGAQTPGVFHVRPGDARSEERLLRRIRQVRPRADVVVLSVHWGPNMELRPSRARVALGRRAVEAGADIVHGHSAHVFQGVALHRERPILYDTGDFVDDYAVDARLRNDWSFLFTVHLSGARVTGMELLPCRIDDLQVNGAGPEGAAIMSRMRGLCRELGTPCEIAGERLHIPVARAAPGGAGGA